MFLAGDGAEFSDFGFKARKEAIEDTDEIFFVALGKLSLKIPEPEPHDKGPAQEH